MCLVMFCINHGSRRFILFFWLQIYFPFLLPPIFSFEGSPKPETTSPAPYRLSLCRGHSCWQDGDHLAEESALPIPVGEPFERVTIHVCPNRARWEQLLWQHPATALLTVKRAPTRPTFVVNPTVFTPRLYTWKFACVLIVYLLCRSSCALLLP